MKKYFCDVCGTELKTVTAPPAPAAELCHLEDLCPRCDVLARGLDVSGLVMAELRRLIEEKPEEPAAVGPAQVPTGRGAKEKRAILAAVEAYRRKNAPGSLTALAKQARVGEAELRDMISCEKVPLTTWRAVGKALGVAVAEEKE